MVLEAYEGVSVYLPNHPMSLLPPNVPPALPSFPPAHLSLTCHGNVHEYQKLLVQWCSSAGRPISPCSWVLNKVIVLVS